MESERSLAVNTLAVSCGREFLMGVVARVLMDEPEDLFTMRRISPDFELCRRRLPDGPGVRPVEAESLLEDGERWDGLY